MYMIPAFSFLQTVGLFVSAAFCLFSDLVPCLGSIIVQNNVFFIQNIEHYINHNGTLNLRGLSYFSTLKSGQEKFSHKAKRNLTSFSTNVFILSSTVLSCRDKMENMSYCLVWLCKQSVKLSKMRK